MKLLKTAYFGIFLSIFLLAFGALMCKAIYEEAEGICGQYGMNKVAVNLINRSDVQEADKIGLGDIAAIKEDLGGTEITCSASIKGPVSGNNNSKEADITGTTCNFPAFRRMRMIRGSFFSKEAEAAGSQVAVVDESLARDLFNSVEVVGSKIIIFGKSFTVVGVCEADGSIVTRLIDSGRPAVYIPAGVLLDSGKDAYITSIEVGNPYNDTLGKNAEIVSKALQTAGKNPSAYKITDLNLKGTLIGQKSHVIVFIMGFGVILMFFLYIKQEVTRFVKKILNESKGGYLSPVIRSNLAAAAVLVIKATVSILLALVVWRLIRFRLYIPPEYVPPELIDPGYFIDLVKGGIIAGNSYRGYVASYPELVINAAQTVTNLSFYSGAVLGMLFFYLGLHKVGKSGADIVKTLLLGGVFTAAALVSLVGIEYVLGLNMSQHLESIGIIWAFVYISILKFGEKKERSSEINV